MYAIRDEMRGTLGRFWESLKLAKTLSLQIHRRHDASVVISLHSLSHHHHHQWISSRCKS